MQREPENLGTRLASQVTNNQLFYHLKTYRTYQRKFSVKFECFDVVFVNLFLPSSFLLWLQETEHQILLTQIHQDLWMHKILGYTKTYGHPESLQRTLSLPKVDQGSGTTILASCTALAF